MLFHTINYTKVLFVTSGWFGEVTLQVAEADVYLLL